MAEAVIGMPGSQWVTGSKRSTERRVVFYVTSLSWNGDRAERFTYSQDKAKAAPLRLKTALRVARQLHRGGRKPFLAEVPRG